MEKLFYDPSKLTDEQKACIDSIAKSQQQDILKTKIEIIAAPQVRTFVIRNTVIDDNGTVVKQTVKKCNYQDATFVFEGEAVKETIKSRYFGTEPEAVDFLAVKDAEDMDLVSNQG